MTNPDIPALLLRAQNADRPAFEKLVHLTARMVYAQIAATIKDRQKAEDLTQETFLAAWKSLHSVNQSAGFNSWLLTIARTTTLDAIKFEARLKRRDQNKSSTQETADTLPDRAPSPPENLESTEACNHALRLLEELPEEYRRPLMLRYLGGADYQTIMQQLNLSDGALRGLLNRGMALLRERMTKQEH